MNGKLNSKDAGRFCIQQVIPFVIVVLVKMQSTIGQRGNKMISSQLMTHKSILAKQKMLNTHSCFHQLSAKILALSV